MMKVKEIVNQKANRVLITANDPTGVYHQMRAHFAPLCRNQKERCWLKKAGLKESEYPEIFDNFKPEQPDEWKQKPNAWLSNMDIEKVLHDFEWNDKDNKKASEFKLLGPSPIDFDTKVQGACVDPGICQFSITKFMNKFPGKTKIGFVFNTDPHYRSGEHWISLYLDLDNLVMMFFDSTGNAPPPEVLQLINRIKMDPYMKELENKKNLKLLLPRSKMKHQSKNTECGIYTLFFLTTMLTGKVEFETVVRTPRNRHKLFSEDFLLTDDYIQQYRDIYFDDDDDDVPIIRK